MTCLTSTTDILAVIDRCVRVLSGVDDWHGQALLGLLVLLLFLTIPAIFYWRSK